MKQFFILSGAFFFLYACGGQQNEAGEQGADKGVPFVEPEAITSLYDEDLKPFYHGVASGDPLKDAVIIWTRVTPEFQGEVTVNWKVAKDEDMSAVVQEGSINTDSTKDYTVKVDVKDLDAGTTYWYQFEAFGEKSIVGRTKTAGADGLEKVELAFASCSNYEWGYFNNYRLIANDRSIDAVIHLGDYIYEYAPGGYGDTTIGRIVYPPKEITTLADYRHRYSQYRTDKDLRAAHQMHPFITIWDDHESANNSYIKGAQNHTDSSEGNWDQRKSLAVQTYYEWLPIRDDEKLYRTFEFGDLVNMMVLDTRFEGRTVQVDSMDDPHYMDEDRKIIGDEQFEVLMTELQKSHQWKLIGNQVPFGPMINDYENGKGRYLDGWDGYPVERAKVVNAIKDAGIQNLVIVTGDYHSSFAFETDMDATAKTEDNIAVEFVVPSINSANTNEYVSNDTTAMVEQAYLKFNPHLKYVNLRDHGYVKLTITPEKCVAQFLYSETLSQPSEVQKIGPTYVVKDGEAQLSTPEIK